MNADTTSKCAYLFKNLKKHGVSCIEIGFYGSGDDGQMEWQNVHWFNENMTDEEADKIWDSPTIFSWGRDSWGETGKNITLGELVDDVAEGVLHYYDVDYQNNQGNNGGIVFDVETGKIRTQYRVYETKDEELYI